MYKVKTFSVLELAEPIGTKEKYWTNKKFLFKVGRQDSQEDVSEKIACEIANLIKLPSAQYELAIRKNGTTKKGVASKIFLQEAQVLVLGNEMLSEVDKNYPKDEKDWHRVKEYTLDRVLILIRASQMLKKSKKDILRNFVGYLVFDCLIGNQDRHHKNWGFIIDGKSKSLALAPSFDHASGVASKMRDEKAKERLETKDKNYTIEAYCKKAKTPFYKNDTKLKTFEVVKELISMQNNIKTYTIEWIDKISQIKKSDYQSILDKIPKDLITQNQKDFIMQMLAINTKILQEIKDGTNE